MEATEASPESGLPFGPKVPTPPPSFAAAKWPGQPNPNPLLAFLGTWALVPATCLSWLDLVILEHSSPPHQKGLWESFPQSLSWVPVHGRQGAPSGPRHLPGTKLRGKRTFPRLPAGWPCITSIGGICCPEAAGIYLRPRASSCLRLPCSCPQHPSPPLNTGTLTLVFPSAAAPNAASAAAR